jgi:hypothetical protein
MKRGEIDVHYKITGKMISDAFTKALQGTAYRVKTSMMMTGKD